MNKAMDMYTHARIKNLESMLELVTDSLRECVSLIEDNYEQMDYATMPAVATLGSERVLLAYGLLKGT